ncbi:OST-HTH/LOTUS domain-containing protein [Catenuloplanes japonicus]|uniref:OST-HTH/LOTUS domain-containing protein n=1 Tax=Catenuloplanes japonicus TaxID=33876 RepID=UPI000689215E|nr:OST-HTH/LOTUS domain-containing protein [Catenuloplanes japonicus]
MHRLREFGKHVVGVGTEASASQRLVAVCSEYKFWGTIFAEVEPATRPALTAAFDLADAERLAVQAITQSRVDTPTASALKNKMLALDPSFDEANYGCTSFRAFLARLAHRIRIDGTSGSDITVSLIHTGEAS